ncbi:MAG: LysM peptidoglycan-binding domain-containing protein [Candidatus Sulfobium sp.]
MSKKILLQLIVVLILLVPSFVPAQTHEIKIYTVQKGDTLWSISRAQLGDPFLWPKVWKENPEISNPDRLYPGEVVKIPVYLKQKVREEGVPAARVTGKMPEKQQEEAKAVEQKPVKIPLKPLISDDLMAASGYISDTVPAVGMIEDSPSGKSLFGNDDTVFVQTDKPADIGDKFVIIKALRLETPMATRDKGYIIEPIGVVEITKVEGGDVEASIVKAFGPVRSGDLLDTYYATVPPLTTGEFRKPDIQGEVIAARNLRLLNALFDIVYLDKGLKDGIEIGDMFRTVNTSSGHTIPTGIIQVIGERENTSTAVVRGNTGGAISAGNQFTQLK